MAGGFDPDAYLSEKGGSPPHGDNGESGGDFDPDHYLAAKAPKSAPDPDPGNAIDRFAERTGIAEPVRRVTGAALAYGSQALTNPVRAYMDAYKALRGEAPEGAQEQADRVRAGLQGATLGTAGTMLGRPAQYAQAEEDHPIAAAAGGAAIPLPMPAKLAAMKGLSGAALRTLTRAGEMGLLEGGAAAVKGDDIAPAATRGAAYGAGGQALGEAAGAVGRVASKPIAYAQDEIARQIGEKSGLDPAKLPPQIMETVRDRARDRLSGAANKALASGVGNVATAGLAGGVGAVLGGPVGHLVGAGSASFLGAQGAKQLAKGLLMRPAVLERVAKFERWGPALGKAAAGGSYRLAAALMGLDRADPDAKHRLAQAVAGARDPLNSEAE